MSTSTRDAAWFEETYRGCRRAVLAYVLRRLPSQEADDIVAEVFSTAWRCRDAVPDEPLPWLYRTAANHILHARRGEARRGRLADRAQDEYGRATHQEWAEDDAFTAVVAALDAQVRVHAMLAHLPPSDAEILCLAAWEGLDARQIGEVLGCSTSAARVRLHRARRQAERMLARIEEDRSPRAGVRSASVARLIPPETSVVTKGNSR